MMGFVSNSQFIKHAGASEFFSLDLRHYATKSVVVVCVFSPVIKGTIDKYILYILLNENLNSMFKISKIIKKRLKDTSELLPQNRLWHFWIA